MVMDETMGCSSSIIDTLHLLFTTIDTFFTAALPLLPHSLQIMPFFLQALNECINHYSTLLHMSCGDEAAVRPSSMTNKGVFASSVLTRARSMLIMEETPKVLDALSHQSLQSLCTRLCNISVARERPPHPPHPHSGALGRTEESVDWRPAAPHRSGGGTSPGPYRGDVG